LGNDSVLALSTSRVLVNHTNTPKGDLDIASSAGAVPLVIRGRSSDGSAQTEFWSYNGATRYGVLGSTPSFSYFGSIANTSLYFLTNSIERMRITSDGNVGIGTSAPTATLGVSGSLAVSGVSTFSSVTTVNIGAAAGDTFVVDKTGGANISFFASTVYSGQIDCTTSGDLKLSSRSTYPAVVIKDAGNVGIGTTAPTQKLSVAGGISGKDFISLTSTAGISVSTSATTISSRINQYGGFAIVWGNDSGNIFSDAIFYSLGAVFVIASQSVSGSASARTYTTSGSGDLLLTMSSGTYDVYFQGFMTS
jgi:hypothetical protein